MSALEWPKIPKRDILRALQACYYVLHTSVVEDHEFDALQKEYKAATGRDIPVGSDMRDSYTDTEWSLALYFALKHRWSQAGVESRDIPKMKEGKNPKQVFVDKHFGDPKHGKGR